MDGISPISGLNGGRQLTPAEHAEVAKLMARDREVRAHEAAHMAVAGTLASDVEYTYQMGPDGKLYAVGGKVRIILTPGQTPEETLAKARQLRAAANAPLDPSGQDMIVAAEANEMEANALQEIAKEHAPAPHHPSDSPGLHPHGLDKAA